MNFLAFHKKMPSHIPPPANSRMTKFFFLCVCVCEMRMSQAFCRIGGTIRDPQASPLPALCPDASSQTTTHPAKGPLFSLALAPRLEPHLGKGTAILQLKYPQPGNLQK